MLTLILAIAIWPFPDSGVASVRCYERSANPAGSNCQVELIDQDPAHEHTVLLRYTDGTAFTVIFRGLGYFIPIEAGKHPASIKVFGKRSWRRVE